MASPKPVPGSWPYGRDETERRLAAYGGSPRVMAIAEGLDQQVTRLAVIAYGLPYTRLPRGGRAAGCLDHVDPRRLPPGPAVDHRRPWKSRGKRAKRHPSAFPVPDPDPNAYQLIKRGKGRGRAADQGDRTTPPPLQPALTAPPPLEAEIEPICPTVTLAD